MYILVQGQQMVLRSAPGHSKQPGETVTLYVAQDQLHLFIDGQRVEGNRSP